MQEVKFYLSYNYEKDSKSQTTENLLAGNIIIPMISPPTYLIHCWWLCAETNNLDSKYEIVWLGPRAPVLFQNWFII